MNEALKNLLTELLALTLAGALGGYVAVQVTLAELRTQLQNTAEHIAELQTLTRQHENFRERIARLEVLCGKEK